MGINHAQRAEIAWSKLVAAANQPPGLNLITYGALASSIGIHHRALPHVLGLIQEYCIEQKLPPLTILVVSKVSGVPGLGFIAWDVDDLDSGLRQVAEHPWGSLPNPFSYAKNGETEDSLAQRIVEDPKSACDVYALVKVRGVAQRIFRKALLHLYEGRCAFCGASFEPILQAAHLIPWSKCSQQERLSPSNGLLLCANHHRMLDCGQITLDLEMKIFFDDEADVSAFSDADHELSTRLHRRRAFLPSKKKFWPSLGALRTHHEENDWDFS